VVGQPPKDSASQITGVEWYSSYMHVIAPARYKQRPKRRPWKLFAAIPVALLVAAATANYLRPLPMPMATVSVSLPRAETVATTWPVGGQAAIAADGYGLLGTHGDGSALATASIAKVITALCVLQKQPLDPDQSGPTYTIGIKDVEIYNNYVAQNGSVVPVSGGEKLTEYQALQALMIPSANNIADSLVNWVFGSQDAYSTYATDYLRQNGLNDTHIGLDASGFDPGTVSTASNLTKVGLLALKNPVLMQIAGQQRATLPVAGTVRNYNTILGVNGVTGLKTGNNDADPGAFLFTATAQVGGQAIPLTGAVMGAADLDSALRDSTRLVASIQQSFEQVTVAAQGQRVGTVRTAWGAAVPLTTRGTLQVVRWKTTPLSQTNYVDVTKRSGTMGMLKIAAGGAHSSTELLLQKPLPAPSFWWRLTRH
jgi:D-alanyl-D-alanine carboxypeptidase (penicillin-binding protein 5/6)